VGKCAFLDASNLNLFSDGDDGSVLLAEVYQEPFIGQGELVGMLAESIAGILGRLNNGGTKRLNDLFY